MLQRRRVHDEIGAGFRQHPLQPGRIAHIGDDHVRALRRGDLGQFLAGSPQREFAIVQQHQPRRPSVARVRASAPPMLPPAPVINTTRPRTS